MVPAESDAGLLKFQNLHKVTLAVWLSFKVQRLVDFEVVLDIWNTFKSIRCLLSFFLLLFVLRSDRKERTKEEEEEKHGWEIHPPEKFERFCQTWTSGDRSPDRWELIALAGYTTRPSSWRWIWLARLALADKMVQGWQNLSDPFPQKEKIILFFFQTFRQSGFEIVRKNKHWCWSATNL